MQNIPNNCEQQAKRNQQVIERTSKFDVNKLKRCKIDLEFNQI